MSDWSYWSSTKNRLMTLFKITIITIISLVKSFTMFFTIASNIESLFLFLLFCWYHKKMNHQQQHQHQNLFSFNLKYFKILSFIIFLPITTLSQYWPTYPPNHTSWSRVSTHSFLPHSLLTALTHSLFHFIFLYFRYFAHHLLDY